MDKISEIHDILTATILPPCHQMIYDIVSQTTAKQLKMVKDKNPTSASASGPEARAETEARAVVSTVKASKVKQNPGQTPQQTTRRPGVTHQHKYQQNIYDWNRNSYSRLKREIEREREREGTVACLQNVCTKIALSNV